jgi:hypothetical protein
MSGLATPRGPLPARVYWTRRLILVAVAALLVLTLGRVLTGGSDGSGDAGSTKNDKATQVAGVPSSPDGGATDAATTAATPGAQGGKPPLAQPDGPCRPEDLTVAAEVGQTPNDGQVEIVLAVSGTKAACTFTFSQESVVVKISSGADSIWSSQQCKTLPSQDVVVRSALPAKVPFVWNGHRSDEDCSRGAAWAKAGAYHVVSAPLGGEPTDVQFELTRPPAVVVTKTAKPKQVTQPAG